MIDAEDPSTLEDWQILDISRSLERLDQERDFLKEILALFTIDGPARLERVEECLAEGDLESAGKAAHSIKGMCGTINAPALMDVALRMEQACRGADVTMAKMLLPVMRRHVQAVLEQIENFMQTP